MNIQLDTKQMYTVSDYCKQLHHLQNVMGEQNSYFAIAIKKMKTQQQS